MKFSLRALARCTLLFLPLACASSAHAETAYPAFDFADSIGVNTHLAFPQSAYYNVNLGDRNLLNLSGLSAAPRVKTLLEDLGVKHIRYDVCDPTPPSSCIRGNATARMLYDTLGIKVLDSYFSSGGKDTAKLNTPTSIAAEVSSKLALAASPVNAPTIEALEGPNEPDAKGTVNWQAKVSQAQALAVDALSPGGAAATLGDRPLLPAGLSAPASTAPLLSWAGNATYQPWSSAPLAAANQHAYFYTACPEAGIAGADIKVDAAVTCPAMAPKITCAGGNPPWLRCANQLVGSSKPIWVTETGYTTSLDNLAGVSEKAAATYLPRLLLEGWRRQAQEGRGFSRTYVYELLDARQGPSCAPAYGCSYDRDAGHGLVTASYVPKQQYRALKNLLALLGGVNGSAGAPTAELDVSVAPSNPNVVRRLLFRKSDGSYMLALWRPVSVWRPATMPPPWYQVKRGAPINEGTAPNTTAPVTITLPDATGVTVYRPSQSALPVEVQDASTTHTITAHADVTLVNFSVPDAVPTDPAPTTP